MSALDLSDNDFYLKSGNELAQILAAIPEGVSMLKFAGNFFDQQTGAELALGFAKMSPGVTTLDLGRNNFERKSAEELTRIFQAIPKSVARIVLSFDEFLALDSEKRNAIQTSHPHAEQIILAHSRPYRQLNPLINRSDANVYQRLGFKVSPPSLFHLTSFFVSRHQEPLNKIVPDFEPKLHSGLLEGINRFGGGANT